MKKIGIFGMGCIGSVLSKYLLQNRGAHCYLFNRSPRDRIIIHLVNDVYIQAIELSEVDQIYRPLDWLIICLKEYHIKEASLLIKKLIGPNTKVAVFQNGINLSEPYEAFTDKRNILEAIIDCPTQRNNKGAFVQFYHPKITLASNKLSRMFSKLFGDSNIEFEFHDAFKQLQWSKLIESSSLGTIQAIHEETCTVFKDDEVFKSYLDLLQEGVMIAKSCGIILGEKYLEEVVLRLYSYPDKKGSSMLTDRLESKPLELNAKIGILAKIGIRNKLSIPTTFRCYRSLLDYNQSLNH